MVAKNGRECLYYLLLNFIPQFYDYLIIIICFLIKIVVFSGTWLVQKKRARSVVT